MSAITSKPAARTVHYPESDGQPIAENTLQFEWITTIKGGLEALFRENPNVFVAGDLLWYPVEGDPTIRTAPDAMVVFGRPKGYRGSYMQWVEDNIPPQVVFEVLSPGNRVGEMLRKHKFYEQYGVEEYYVYNPDHITLEGWLRDGSVLKEIPETNGYVSPRLTIRFQTDRGDLEILGPDGKKFAAYVELVQQRDALAQQRDQERARAERLAAQLKALGLDPEA